MTRKRLPRSDRDTALAVAVGMLEVLLGTKRLIVWRVADERLEAIYGFEPEQQRAAACQVRQRHAAELAAGRPVRAHGGLWLPLAGAVLVGCVQVLDEPRPLPDALTPSLRATLDGLAWTLGGRGDAPVEVRDTRALHAAVAPAKLEVDVDSAGRQLREAERQRFLYRLRYHDGNLTRTADMYGVSRTTGWRMMKRLDVERDAPAPTDPRRGKKQPAS